MRAGNVVAGSQLAALAMQAFDLNQLVLAPWALREGIIIEYLKHEAGAVPVGEAGAQAQPRHATVVTFARRYDWDEAHSCLVAELAVSLFDQTQHLHELGAAERELLYFSGLLHDVGAAVAQSGHHKHSLYIISNADIEGFSARERTLMANVARYHRRALPSQNHVEYMALSAPDQRLVRRLGALLRLADGLDPDHLQVVESVRVSESAKAITLELEARDEPHQALWAVGRLSDLFEAEFGRKVRPMAQTVA
jgi:exopolyphosphatase/guanosine-5'-triphosphate,3'-diphosphate pyrophosphatase